MRRIASLLPISLCLLAACSFDEPGQLEDTSDSDWQLDERDQPGAPDASHDMSPLDDLSPPPRDMPTPPVDMPRADMGPDLPAIEPDMPAMSCGDGLVDPGERCDGDCPATVTDCAPPPPEACARVRLDGSAARCDAQCVYFQQSACVDQDGCCPQGCTSNNDDDCSPPDPRCGDGVLDAGERCDGDCPVTAADCPPLGGGAPGNVCFESVVVGSAARCDARCEVAEITQCVNQDNCCPQGCTSSNDDDCSPQGGSCGDGSVDPGELCDGNCPLNVSQCDDANACTRDSLMGLPNQCTAQCVNTPITACQSGDGCCPQGCTSAADADCAPPADRCGAPLPSPLPGGPSSVIDTLQLGTSSTAGRDYTGDGQVDNALGDTLDQLGSLIGFTRADYNAAITSQIANGTLALLLEHRAVTTLVGPQSYALAWLQGSPRCFQAPVATGQNAYEVLSSSYGANGAPRSLWPAATLSVQRQLDASSTTLHFPISFVGASIEVPLRGAAIRVMVDPARSGLPHTGVALASGNLSGYLTLQDLYAGINTYFRASCSCASPSNTDLVRTTATGGHACNTINTNACAQGSACRALDDNCSLLTTILPQITDVSSQSPGSPCGLITPCDSLSAGFTFTASGAVLVGTTP